MVVDLTGSRRGIEYDIQAIDNIAAAGFPNVLNTITEAPEEAGILHFYIQDMSTPKFSQEYWNLLTQDIRNLLTKGTDVLVMCMGGHGRTGLALSIICHKLAPDLVGDDPITWLREKYCKKIVETDEQIKYIFSVLKLGTPPAYIKPSKQWTSYYPKTTTSPTPYQPFGSYHKDKSSPIPGAYHNYGGKVINVDENTDKDTDEFDRTLGPSQAEQNYDTYWEEVLADKGW